MNSLSGSSPKLRNVKCSKSVIGDLVSWTESFLWPASVD